MTNCNTEFEHTVFDMITREFPSEFEKNISMICSHEAVGFSCFKSNYEFTLKMMQLLKSRNNGLKIILGGPEITRQYFKTGGQFTPGLWNLVDLFVVGEGELSLESFLTTQRNPKIFLFNQMTDLDRLPYPVYEGLDLNTYEKKNTIPIQFSRGCFRNCHFCSEKLLHRGTRLRSTKSVIEEIRYHVTVNNISTIVFYDSSINADPEALEKLCDEIMVHFGSINWEAQIAIRKDLSPALLSKMKKSGCYHLFVGMESGSDATLKKMNKGFSTGDAIEFFKKLNTSRLSFGISMITGYPGESEKEFEESLQFLISNKHLIPKIEQINPFTYYDGTAADRNGDYKNNSIALDRYHRFVSGIKQNGFKYTSAFLGNLIEKNG